MNQTWLDDGFDFSRFAALIENSVSDRNIMLANDEELEQMGQLTEDDLDIFRGLPSGDRASVGQSPAMGTGGGYILLFQVQIRIGPPKHTAQHTHTLPKKK